MLVDVAERHLFDKRQIDLPRPREFQQLDAVPVLALDDDGDALVYLWEQLDGPWVMDPTSTTDPTLDFDAPSVVADTELTFQLVVLPKSLKSS